MKHTVLFCAFALVCSSCGDREEIMAASGEAMGTTWRLAWRAEQHDPDLCESVSATLLKWEDVMSQWEEGSDLSRFNRGEAATVELRQVIDLAEEIRVASGGAFDHRLLKETGESGFGPGGDGMDLSAIGKGFAVDRVGEVLRERGISDFVFELGGEILVGDSEWEVAIEKPDPASGGISRRLKLREKALATSGNYRLFKPAEGGLAGHIIDPRTGGSVIRPPCSVSVIANDCATADAWATALFVLGPGTPAPDGIEVIWNGLQATD